MHSGDPEESFALLFLFKYRDQPEYDCREREEIISRVPRDLKVLSRVPLCYKGQIQEMKVGSLQVLCTVIEMT